MSRKWGYCSNVEHKNLMLYFSCSPDITAFEKGPDGAPRVRPYYRHAHFLEELTIFFENNYQSETLTLEIPRQLKEIQLSATGSELITANSIQPLKLIYAHNVVQKSIANIFINSTCNGLVYKDAQKKGI